MVMQRLRIGVIGCGIGGMAAALHLARDGHDVTVFDRFPEPQPLGAGLLLQPTGQAVLAGLGLGAAVAAAGARIDALDSRNRQGRSVLDLEYALIGRGTGLGIHRARLFAILWHTVQKAPVRLVLGQDVTAVMPEDGGLRLADGREFIFDLVVGATGAHSALRTFFSVARDRLYPWGCLWASVALPQELKPNVLQQRVDGARIMIGMLPIGSAGIGAEAQAAFFWSLRNDRVAAWRAAPFGDWKQQVLAVWPDLAPVMAGFTDHTQLTHAMYRDAGLRRSVTGKAVAIGDLAHATSPQLGQGANLALLDAAVLAACLRETESDVTAALAAYDSHRRPQHLYYRWASRALTPLFQADAAWLGWLRDNTLPLAHRIPWAKRRMLETLAGIAVGPWRNLPSA
jgi:salicylate hydroxylase